MSSSHHQQGTKNAEISSEGYKKTLGRRHVQMIAIGGAIGVGLFMGSGGRLASTGPALIFSYALAGGIAYLLMRALGELIMYRQTSGSFVSYAGELFGPKGAFVSGWMYVLNWVMTGIAELVAIGLYFQYFFPRFRWKFRPYARWQCWWQSTCSAPKPSQNSNFGRPLSRSPQSCCSSP